jgi:hypothetical protein
MKVILAVVAVCLLMSVVSAESTESIEWYDYSSNDDVGIHLYFFWSAKCPHCQEAQSDLERMVQEYPWLILHSYELTRNPHHVQRYIEMAALFDREANSVPAFMFCGNWMTGFDSSESTGKELSGNLLQCYRFVRHAKPPQSTAVKLKTNELLSLPILGEVDISSRSLLTLTIMIAALDAFNPCAFFVLLFLLSMLIHARDAHKMLLVGAIFVFFSGLIYFVFMAAWLNLFLYFGGVAWVTFIAGFVAIIMASLNIKDYFLFKEGPSLSIADSARSRLFGRIRLLVGEENTLLVIFATILLALAANSYELLCTAGFPMVYTRLLTLQSLPALQYYLYLLLYNLVYVLPLTVIVGIFVYKMGARKLTEKEGRILKLLSGYMMLLLGVVLVFQPDFISNMLTALALLIGALVLTYLTTRLSKRE